MTLARRTWLYLTALWLCLAIVLGHALVPLGPSLQGRSGSAFSAFTSEVALGPGRGDADSTLRRANERDRQPRLPGGGAGIVSEPVPLPALAAVDTPPGDARAPALRSRETYRTHDARAPPRA